MKKQIEIKCLNKFCDNIFTGEDRWICEVCKTPLCIRCLNQTIEVKGVVYSFCDKHPLT